MAKNRHAVLINRLNWHRSEQWNALCVALRPNVEGIVNASLASVCHHARDEVASLRGSLNWDLLIMLLEREFEDVAPPTFYLPVLLPIYQSGHIPCDWRGPTLDTFWSAGSAPLPAGDVLIY